MTPEETLNFAEERIRLMVKTFIGTVTAATEDHSKHCDSKDPAKCNRAFKFGYIDILGKLLAQELEEAIRREYT